MKINKSKRFNENLYTILDFIAADSLSRALKFGDELEKEIYSLCDNPYRMQKIYSF